MKILQAEYGLMALLSCKYISPFKKKERMISIATGTEAEADRAATGMEGRVMGPEGIAKSHRRLVPAWKTNGVCLAEFKLIWNW